MRRKWQQGVADLLAGAGFVAAADLSEGSSGPQVLSLQKALLAAGFDLPTAMATANRAAGIVVGKLGTAVVSYQELFPGEVA